MSATFKQKGHQKAQCPKLLHGAQTSQQPYTTQQYQRLPPTSQQWRPRGQLQQQAYRSSQPNTTTLIPEVASSQDLNMVVLIQQFQKFLTTHPSPKSYVMSTPSSSSLPSPSTSSKSSSLWVLDSSSSRNMSLSSSSFVSMCHYFSFCLS